MAAHTKWFLLGGDLPTAVSEGLDVLQSAMAGKLEMTRQL
jgi:hypothetical protein